MQASAKQHEAYRYLLIDSKANAQALNFFGLNEKDLPVYVVHDAADGRDDKYVSKKTKPSSLDGFLSKFEVCHCAAGVLRPVCVQGLACT